MYKMKEFFELQLNTAIPLDEKAAPKMAGKTFQRNEYQTGDQVLYFLLEKSGNTELFAPTKPEEITLDLVTCVEREFENMEKNLQFVRYVTDRIPVFKNK